MSRVEPYAVGIFAASVCASNDATRDEILQVLNEEHPTGLDHPWSFSSEPKFAAGQSNPCPCDELPESRTHYLLEC